eukprot:m.55982 g.55982  ORF g.55982 m.55982 type:complete len:327 (-) comp12569_c0_seq2:31-1011(-)
MLGCRAVVTVALVLVLLGSTGSPHERGSLMFAAAAPQLVAKGLEAPPVYVIGAMKAGTSALCELLRTHPHIHGGLHVDDEPFHYTKELHYFDNDQRFENGLSFYEAHFENTLPHGSVNLDCTPRYLAKPETPIRISDTYPNDRLRFAAVLREPTDRALSHYRHAMAHSPNHNGDHWTVRMLRKTFEARVHKAIDDWEACAARHLGEDELWAKCSSLDTFNSLVTRGLYDFQIEWWHRNFSPSDFCFVTTDAMRRNTTEVLLRVADFFGVDNSDTSWATIPPGGHSNSDTELTPDPETIERLRQFYKRHGTHTYSTIEQQHGGFLGC